MYDNSKTTVFDFYIVIMYGVLAFAWVYKRIQTGLSGH